MEDCGFVNVLVVVATSNQEYDSGELCNCDEHFSSIDSSSDQC